ncbi:MAG: hypothetical protein LAN64_06935 [Acidobacteriia bacterium]|nr:hypothetical protein [Terriglobia bacterium]
MKAFLQALLTPFRSWLDKLRVRREPLRSVHGAAIELAAEERLSRFLYSRSKYWRSANKAKPDAFTPFPHQSLSTAHITGMADRAIWDLSKSTLGNDPGRDKVYARADLDVADVLMQKLQAFRDNHPFERHTNIIGWPHLSDPAEQKALWLQIALELSLAATLQISAVPVSKSKRID